MHAGDMPALIMSKKYLGHEFEDVIRLNTTTKRIVQLANDILSFFEQEKKVKEWKPSNEEFVWALERMYGKGNHMHFFVIDWIRKQVTLGNKEGIKQGQEIYEWLKSNEDWLYGKKRK